jgi:hypothetical protein
MLLWIALALLAGTAPGACGSGGWGSGYPDTLLGDLPDGGARDEGGVEDASGPGDTGIVYECGKGPGNKKGIGAPCTKSGNECKADLNCDIDLDPQGVGVCIKLMCTSDTECGSGATCCKPDQGGGIKICLINECLLPECGGPVPDGGTADASDAGGDGGSTDI